VPLLLYCDVAIILKPVALVFSAVVGFEAASNVRGNSCGAVWAGDWRWIALSARMVKM
jgi:hypothetical protein